MSYIEWRMLLGTEGEGSRAGEVDRSESWRSDWFTAETAAGMYFKFNNAVMSDSDDYLEL